MKFLDLFAGVGGFRLGMQQAGHECIGYVEIDKYARKSYQAIHDAEGEWTAHDITTVTDDDLEFLGGKGIDVICGGFPCQSFSVAGKRGGFKDTRGTLFFEIARIAKQIKPRILLLENVKGLLSHEKGKTYRTILNALDELGYDAEWQVLNSKDFSTKERPTPQNRERIFIVGHLRGSGGREVFPVEGENGEPIKVVGQLEGKYRTVNEILGTSGSSTCLNTMGGGNREPKILDDQGRTKKKNKLQDYAPTLRRESHGNDPKVVQPVLTPDRPNKRQNGRRFKENGEPMFTLTSQDRHGVIFNIKKPDEYRIRKLTPKECWRLQGFPDWAFEKAEEVNSNSQLYKQAGNSVTVNVVYEIAKRL